MNPSVVFHDKAYGGWYCNVCKGYIHPDMIHQHMRHEALPSGIGFGGWAYPMPRGGEEDERV